MCGVRNMTQRARVIALDIETISETGVPASKYFGFLRFHWPETPGTDFVSITLSRPWKNDRVINLRSGFSTEQLSRCHLVLGQELARVWREMVRQPWLKKKFLSFLSFGRVLDSRGIHVSTEKKALCINDDMTPRATSSRVARFSS